MSKKTTAILAVIVLLAMILTGTFAWTQYNQHKTNEANGSGLRYDVSLIENFKEITNWKASESYTKEIRVTNSGLLDGSYGDVYVRLQLKEYMEMFPLIYEYSKQRLMIDEDGEFITFATEALARAAYSDREPASLKGLEDTVNQWYIPTKEGDDNGQYGKYLLLSASSGEATPLIADTKRATDTESHDLTANGECDYPIHVWQATSGEAGDCEQEFHEYIKWYLGDDVISIDDWTGTPTEAWIYDTDSEEGWVYWGTALAPGETTSNLLESIQLIKQPDDNFYYAIHTDMEAISFSEIMGGLELSWGDAPGKVVGTILESTVASLEIADGDTGVARGTEYRLSLAADGTGSYYDAAVWSIEEVNYMTRTLGTFAAGNTGTVTSTKDGSTISQNGVLYIAPGETAVSLKVTAVSRLDSEKKGSAVITLSGALVSDVTVSGPGTAKAGTTAQYSASVTGLDNPSQEVRWAVTGSSNKGTYIETAADGKGTLHVAFDETNDRTLTVTAVSAYDETQSRSMTVTVSGWEITGIMVTPTEASLLRGGSETFTATVDGNNEPLQEVKWSLSGNEKEGTRIDATSGELTIADDETSQELTVTATSAYDGNKKGEATVNVGQVTGVTVNPTSATMARRGTQDFTVALTAADGVDTTYNWTIIGSKTSDDTAFDGDKLTIGTDETATTLTVRATSVHNADQYAEAVVSIGQVESVSLDPTEETLSRGDEKTFVPDVVISNEAEKTITWSLSSEAGGSSIDTNGKLTIGATETEATLTVTATSVYDSSKYATATVTVPQVSGVTLDTTEVTLSRKDTKSFTPTVAWTGEITGNPAGVTWAVSGSTPANSSTIDVDGKLTIGADETATSLTVTATSAYDSSKYATATVTVPQVSGVTLDTTEVTLSRKGTQDFTPTVAWTDEITGNPAGVTWAVSGSTPANSSTIDADGKLTIGADETATSLTVTATSAYDSSKYATATVTVPQVSGVTLDITEVTLSRKGTQDFTPTVAWTGEITGNPAGVTWAVSGSTPANSSTIDADGKLTIGADETATSLTITATSAYDSTMDETATVTVPQVSGVTLDITEVTLSRKGTQTFVPTVAWTDEITGDPAGVIWSVNSTGGSSIDGNGKLTIGAYEQALILTVTATSAYDSTMDETATVYVRQVTTMSLDPAAVTLNRGDTKTFVPTVVVSNAAVEAEKTVTWSLSSTSGGSYISSGGMLTIGAGETASALTVTATSTYDTDKIATAAVTVLVPEVTGVTVTPGNVTVYKGYTQTFAASVLGVNNPEQTVTWSVEGTGTASPDTKFNGATLRVGSDETRTTLTVKATSTIDTSRSNTATVTVADLPVDSTPRVMDIKVTGATVNAGSTTLVAAVVTVANDTGVDKTVKWSVSGNTSGSTTIDPDTGYLEVGLNEESSTFQVIATSNYDDTKSGAAIITVRRVTGVNVTPNDVTVYKGYKQTFTASVLGVNSPDQSVTWSVDDAEASNTKFNGSTLTLGDETKGTITVRATSTANPNIWGTATVRVAELAANTPLVTDIRVTGTTVNTGATATIGVPTVIVENGAEDTVTWSVSGNTSSLTNINSSSRLLTVGADETASTFQVIATSTYDTTKSGTATIKVRRATSVTLTPDDTTVYKGYTQKFAVSVEGINFESSTQQGVTWSVTGGITGTSITTAGVLTVAAGETASRLTVTAKSSVTTAIYGEATVRVADLDAETQQVISVVFGTTSYSVNTGATTTIVAPTVTVANSASQAVTWSVSGNTSSLTNINSSSRLLTVGADETASTFQVIATSGFDNTKYGVVTITVARITSVTISPGTAVLGNGDSQGFSVTTTGVNSTSTGVTWSITTTGLSGTSISSYGVLTIGANETNTEIKIKATSSVTKSVYGEATITVPSEMPTWENSSTTITGKAADVGKKFTADGYTWRVLAVDGEGNMLITPTVLLSTSITTSAQYPNALASNTSQFNPSGGGNAYAGNGDDVADSTLKGVMDTFYADGVPTLKAYVQPVDIQTETMAQYSTTAIRDNGLSVVAESKTATAFALSTSEMNKYFVNAADRIASLNGANASYWLRSPYSSATYATRVGLDGSVLSTVIPTSDSLRPALWVKR